MALIANNIIVGTKPVESVDETSATPVAESTPVMSPVDKKSIIEKTKRNKEHGILFVDGKEKKISSQSKYLLDMLTLDD